MRELRSRPIRQRLSGMTLIEVMVALAIIGLAPTAIVVMMERRRLGTTATDSSTLGLSAAGVSPPEPSGASGSIEDSG